MFFKQFIETNCLKEPDRGNESDFTSLGGGSVIDIFLVVSGFNSLSEIKQLTSSTTMQYASNI